jgi:hypothetical protein
MLRLESSSTANVSGGLLLGMSLTNTMVLIFPFITKSMTIVEVYILDMSH